MKYVSTRDYHDIETLTWHQQESRSNKETIKTLSRDNHETIKRLVLVLKGDEIEMSQNWPKNIGVDDSLCETK